jgi:hypothetical protein
VIVSNERISRRQLLGVGTGFAAPGESWVTVGEEFPGNGWQGDTLLARIHWGRRNRLAPA